MKNLITSIKILILLNKAIAEIIAPNIDNFNILLTIFLAIK